ncbi:MAG: sigma-70 family RNA polymerase sigma factor [Acidimicrobiales bacterium]
MGEESTTGEQLAPPFSDWVVVYEANAERLIKLATFMVGPTDAADVVSEAIARAVRSPQWRSVDNHAGYLSRVVVNEASRMLDRAQRRSSRELRAARRVDVDAVEPPVDVLAAVRSLSGRQRAVVFLTYWEDLTPAMVADRLGVSEGSVRRHLARAKTKLRRVLRD